MWQQISSIHHGLDWLRHCHRLQHGFVFEIVEFFITNRQVDQSSLQIHYRPFFPILTANLAVQVDKENSCPDSQPLNSLNQLNVLPVAS